MATNRWEGVKWNNKEIEILKNNFSVISHLKKLSSMLNRSELAIRSKARNLGLKRNFKAYGYGGWKLSEKTKEKLRLNKLEEKNPNWKGNVKNLKSLQMLHRFIERRKPKPKFCEDCEQEKRLELANINNHKYTRNPKDYKWLCHSCHTKLDEKYGFRKRKGGRFTK